MSDPETSPAPAAAPTDPAELLRSRSYLVLLGFGVIVGVGVAFAAYFFLKGVSEAQSSASAARPCGGRSRGRRSQVCSSR